MQKRKKKKQGRVDTATANTLIGTNKHQQNKETVNSGNSHFFFSFSPSFRIIRMRTKIEEKDSIIYNFKAIIY